MITEYLAVGLGMYLTMSILNRNSFKKATLSSCIKGFLGSLILWPFMLIIISILYNGDALKLKVEKQDER